MLFYSNLFIVFFILFLPVFCLTKGTARLAAVFTASCVFYAWWSPVYIFLLIGFVLFSYYSGFYAARMPRWQFAATLIIVFAPLVFFKYSVFLMNNLSLLLGSGMVTRAAWVLPLGISFITFTVTAYLVDIRKGLIVPEKKFLRYGVFVSFFPHLIAGPIMRAKELLPQLDHLVFKTKFIKLGLYLYAIGMLKKVVFADQIGIFVDKFYSVDSSANIYNSLFAFYGFAAQIYCDFSGYMDMAYGLAFIMGIRLPLNFNRPYAASSIRDFWRRWHMTLSRWLRDYLYIPLGGSYKGYTRTLANIMITMVLGGLWHGASWMFVLWGICSRHLFGAGAFSPSFFALDQIPCMAWYCPDLSFDRFRVDIFQVEGFWGI